MAAPLTVPATLAVRYTNTRGAAHYLGTTEKAVYRLVERRVIPFIKVGKSLKFDLQRLDQWMRRRVIDGGRA